MFNPCPVRNYDTWINMSNLGGDYPCIAFSRDNDLIDYPPPDMDISRFSALAIKFQPHVISDSAEGMMNPVEIDINSDNVDKNFDGTFTITIPKEHFMYMRLPEEKFNNGCFVWN
jgi:hypothetical protein